MILEHGGEGIDFCATGFGRVAEVEGDGASGIEKLEECCIARTCQPATRAIRKHCSVAVVNFHQKEHALGSSAIVKVSEQAGAAPKDIPPGSHKVPTRFPRFLQGSCKVPKVPTTLFHKVPPRFSQLCSNVPTRFPQF